MDVRLPRLGEGADSGTVATIFVKEGETVRKDQAVLELESEKAVASIPSPVGGTISKIFVKDGDEIKVGTLIFSVAEAGTPVVEVASTPEPSQSEEPVVEEQAAEEPEPTTRQAEPPARSTNGFPPAASPSLRKMAREIGLDLARIRGTGNGGRILMSDVRTYIQRLQASGTQPKQPAATSAATQQRPAPASIDFSKWGKVEKKKMTQLRKAISNKMVESWTTIPHVTQFDHVDITDILALRKKYQKAYEKKNASLTLTPFIIKAVVDTLKKHPIFNASIDESAEEIVYKNYYHFGIAVDTEQGLLVPVIRDVDKKSLLDLSIELHDIADRARQRKVALDEMQGGTFTISNQGGIGGAHFTPIVNKPEVAILGIGRATLQPGVEPTLVSKSPRRFVPRNILPLGLSYDHRVIDGANAARFIADLAQAIQSFTDKHVKI